MDSGTNTNDADGDGASTEQLSLAPTRSRGRTSHRDQSNFLGANRTHSFAASRKCCTSVNYVLATRPVPSEETLPTPSRTGSAQPSGQRCSPSRTRLRLAEGGLRDCQVPCARYETSLTRNEMYASFASCGTGEKHTILRGTYDSTEAEA